MNEGLMTIKEMRNHEWWVSWSGGKDSTATILLMREHNIPIKEIVYVRMMYDDELPATLPIMTEFVDESIDKFERWGYKVRVVKSLRTARDISKVIYRKSKSKHKNGKYHGISCFTRGFCEFTHIKTDTIKKIVSSAIAESPYEMIGYASDETNRIHRLGDGKQSIMVALGITEKEAFEICKTHNMLSPLYNLNIYRDGCWFCPNASKEVLNALKQNYPELVKKIYEMICMCDYNIAFIYDKNNWVRDFMDIRGFVPDINEEGSKKTIKKIKKKN